MSNRLDYPFIRLWHETSGSFPYYINALVDRARSEDAPQTAIYNSEGHWRVIDDVLSLDTAVKLLKHSGRYGEPTQSILVRLVERLQQKGNGHA